jgi:gas vesicle protein
MFRGFFWGLVVGAVIGLLYAPQRGEETRAQLQTRFNEFQNTAQDRVSDLRAKSNDLIEQGRQTLNKAQNATPSTTTGATTGSSLNSSTAYTTDTVTGSNL